MPNTTLKAKPMSQWGEMWEEQLLQRPTQNYKNRLFLHQSPPPPFCPPSSHHNFFCFFYFPFFLDLFYVFFFFFWFMYIITNGLLFILYANLININKTNHSCIYRCLLKIQNLQQTPEK